MKKILVTAYAVNPYKGSEDGTGWNIIWQIAKYNKVVAITRKNNREAIEKYCKEHPFEHQSNLTFEYFDLPYWMRFWKRKSRGAMLYFYLWQFFMPLFIKRKKLTFDLAHGLNFHTDSIPCFLWMLGKPFVWGPVGHHPEIPKDYLDENGATKEKLNDKLKWTIKSMAKRFDPFLRISVMKADYILTINSAVINALNLKPEHCKVLPAVGAHAPKSDHLKNNENFQLMSAGRFVPLKGFDLTVLAFAKFYQQLSSNEKDYTTLTLLGKGPMKDKLVRLIQEHQLEQAVKIVDWLPQKEVFEAYQKADVFLFPSHEGAGMVVPEAMSYSVPVICLDNIGPGELIGDEGGIKIPYTNYQQTINELANAIKSVYESPKQLHQLSLGAKHRFESYLDWNKKGKQIDSIYSEVLNEVPVEVLEPEHV